MSEANERAGILSDNTNGSSETRVSGIIRNRLYFSRSGRGSCQVDYLAPTTGELQAGHIKTDSRIQYMQTSWKGALSDNFIYFFSFDQRVLSFQLYSVFSIMLDIGIWLFEVPLDVIFLISRFCFSVIGAPWGPRFCHRSCQVGYIVPAR